MFSILDGRTEFYQWDKDRKIVVENDQIKQVHFCNKTDDCSLVVETYQDNGLTLANVPNVLLQNDYKIRVYAYIDDYTLTEAYFKVNTRSKPADYVYTEVELWSAQKAVEDALEEAKINGDFKGDKGDKGEPGAIKMVVVAELPASGDTDAIYLLPKENGEDNNNFEEYVFTEGAWECIGSAGVEVNLEEYVKFTDYATQNKAGVMQVYNSGYHGLKMSNGILTIWDSTESEIDGRKAYKPITAKNLDYAIKSGLSANQLEWTEEEQTGAREVIGAVGKEDYATQDKAGLVSVPNNNSSGLHCGNGALKIYAADKAVIDAKKQEYKPIVPKYLDYAVKSSLTTNTETLTEEEKANALEWLGVGDKYLAKITTEGSWYDRVYAVDKTGTEQKEFNVSNSFVANTIAQRTPTGALMVQTPTADNHATTKAYVDGLIAELTARIEALGG